MFCDASVDLIQHEVVASLVECSRIEPLPQGGTRGSRWLFNLAAKEPDALKMMQQKLAKYQFTYFNPECEKAWPGAYTTANTFAC